MRTIRDYKGWMAEEITKAYLLETGLVELATNSTMDKFDLIAILKDTNKVIGVTVKATDYSETRILSHYRKTREASALEKMPVLIFYVDSINKKGFFETVNRKLNNHLIPLSKENLILGINKLQRNK